MSSRRLIVAAIAIAVLSNAGCSSPSSTSDGKTNPPSTSDSKTKTTAPAATLPGCPTTDTMKAELGFAYGDLVTTATAKERNCNYVSGDAGIAAVHFQILPAAGDFEAIKIGMSAGGRTVNDLSGLGDQAFSSVLSAGGKDQNTIAARKGTFVIILTAWAPMDKEKSFIAKLLG